MAKVKKQREHGRQSKSKAGIPTISLVGYTNAVKSNLFNQMTKSKVYAADQLFAKLDPTLQRIYIDEVCVTVLANTAGFIRHLPYDLVAAFKATLQKTREASLLLDFVYFADNPIKISTQLKVY